MLSARLDRLAGSVSGAEARRPVSSAHSRHRATFGVTFVAIGPAQVDQALADACGDDPNWLCEWVWDSTSNETLAKLSDWLVGTPITVLLILLGAWILSRLTRR